MQHKVICGEPGRFHFDHLSKFQNPFKRPRVQYLSVFSRQILESVTLCLKRELFSRKPDSELQIVYFSQPSRYPKAERRLSHPPPKDEVLNNRYPKTYILDCRETGTDSDLIGIYKSLHEEGCSKRRIFMWGVFEQIVSGKNSP